MRINQHNAVKILKYYSAIDKTISLNEHMINDLECRYYPGITSSENDGMPKAKGWQASQVESAALNVPDTVYDTIKDLKEQNCELRLMKREIFREINSLEYVCRVIILSRYVEERSWEWIAAQVNYSERQCRNMRNLTLDRLEIKFSKNKYISRHQF